MILLLAPLKPPTCVIPRTRLLITRFRVHSNDSGEGDALLASESECTIWCAVELLRGSKLSPWASDAVQLRGDEHYISRLCNDGYGQHYVITEVRNAMGLPICGRLMFWLASQSGAL